MYDDDYFRGVVDLFAPRVRTRREMEGGERRLAQMIPDGEVRRQLEAVMARPEIAGQFPGGVVEMLEMMGEGGMEELLMEIVGAGGGVGGDGGMPGQMPGFEIVEYEEAEDLDRPDRMHVPEEEDDVLHGDEQDEEEEWEEEEPSVSPTFRGLILIDFVFKVLPRALRNIFARFWGRPAADDSSAESDDEDHVAQDNDIN